jgi:hypothetical protein
MRLAIHQRSTDAGIEKLLDWKTANGFDPAQLQTFNIDLNSDSAETAKKHSIEITPVLFNSETGHQYAVGLDAILALTPEQIATIKSDLAAPTPVDPAATVTPLTPPATPA